MKKRLFVVISFIVIFCLFFAIFQRVIHYRWAGNEDIYSRYMDYIEAEPDSIQVLCFGTSELYAAYDPIVTYGECGITGYNFAISGKSAITQYYQLEYALKYQTPDIVICDFSSLFDDCLPVDNEPLYRKVVDTMPDFCIKCKLIKDIYCMDSSQSVLSWFFPLLRYHSLWNQLNWTYFVDDYVKSSEYKDYIKGSLFRDATYSDDSGVTEITEDLWNYKDEDCNLSNISVEYYDKFIQLCQAHEAKVVAVIPPKINTASQMASRMNTIKKYCDERNVDLINYNSYDAIQCIGLSLQDNYYNRAHLNISGSVLFSKQLARDLVEKYQLEDMRKNDCVAQKWNSEYDHFKEDLL